MCFCPHGIGKYLSVQLQGLAANSLDVEYIYDLNNINLSIKHMDLFIWAGCAYAAKYFSNICPGLGASVFRRLARRNIPATDEVANIWTIDEFYWDIYKLQCH